jgi:two-component system NtrC family sensor kinase
MGRLLIVEDEENLLRALRRALRAAPYTLRTALDAEAALALLDDFQPEVVVSDFRLPGMNGVDLLSQVKARLPHTQRILMTGQADQGDIEAAINRSEIFRFLPKPWGESQLLRTLQSAFEQHALLTENAELQARTRAQNDALQALNAQLEEKVLARTESLRQAQRDWEVTFDVLELPLAVIDSGLRVLRSNRAFRELNARQDVSAPLADAGHCHQLSFGRDSACPGCPLPEALAGQEGAQGELVLDGRTHVVHAFPFDGGKTAVCVYRDVTEERARAVRDHETAKMAAVGQLAGGVAHELNNPLGGLLAFVQLMRRDAGRSADDAQSLALIEESALRCKRIVESLVQFAGRAAPTAHPPLALSRCVEDALALFEGALARVPGVRLEKALAADLPPVLGDPSQLTQVTVHLLQNALDALGPEGGVLTVQTARDPAGLAFSVADTGSGIAPEHLAHLFEPTFTTKPPGQGTGLGLSLTYRIVQDHGGHIDVRSAPGQGARFTVHLPLSSPPPQDLT